MAIEGRSAIALSVVALLASCEPPDSRFTVPEACYAGAAIEIDGLEPGGTLQLYYGLQGGQHVYAPLVVRGVDPRTTSLRVELTRELDGQVVADQVFTRFEPAAGECDVALPATELFVTTQRADGLTVSARVAVSDGERTEMRTIEGVCVSSEGACPEAPVLALEVNGARVGAGARVFLDDARRLRFRVDPVSHGDGLLWGTIGTARIDSAPGVDLAIDAEDRSTVALELVLSEWGGFGGGGVLARWSGALAIGCDVLGDGAECQESEACDRGLADEPSRCRAVGTAAVGEACAGASDCGAGATCVSGACRAWCDPAAPSCDAGEQCIETLDLGLCQPA